MVIFTENDVDGDAFLLLEKQSMRRMIKSEGLLLKFKKAYANLGFNTQKQIQREPKPLKPSPTLSEEWSKYTGEAATTKPSTTGTLLCIKLHTS